METRNASKDCDTTTLLTVQNDRSQKIFLSYVSNLISVFKLLIIPELIQIFIYKFDAYESHFDVS